MNETMAYDSITQTYRRNERCAIGWCSVLLPLDLVVGIFRDRGFETKCSLGSSEGQELLSYFDPASLDSRDLFLSLLSTLSLTATFRIRCSSAEPAAEDEERLDISSILD